MIANIMKTKSFNKMTYDLKGHPRLYKTTFMPKSWTDFDKKLFEC